MKREILIDSGAAATDQDGSAHKRWQLDRIVAELRASREELHSIRRDGVARRAPSREVLKDIVDGLTKRCFRGTTANSSSTARISTISSAIRSASLSIPSPTRFTAALFSSTTSFCRGFAARMQSN